MRKQLHLIIAIILAFAMEFCAQAVFHLPIFIFVPVVLYLIVISQNLPRDLIVTTIPVVFYDFLSGFAFGTSTVSFIVVSFLLFTFKKYIRIDGSTIFLAVSTLAVACLVFSSLFFLQASFTLIIRQMPVIVAEALLVGVTCASIINYYALG